MQVWKLTPNHEAPQRAFELFCERGVLAVGWTETGDLQARQPRDSSDIGGWIKATYPSLKNSGLGGPSLWNFLRLMQIGDRVLVSSRGRRYGVFDVLGDYEFLPASQGVLGYQHTRRAVLTDVSPDGLWAACGGQIATGHNNMWTVALLDSSSFDESFEAIRSSQMFWLNVDRPNRTQVLHVEDGCADVRRRGSFGTKRVEHLNRVGGWLSFPSVDAARAQAHIGVADGLGALGFCTKCIKAHPEFVFDAIAADDDPVDLQPAEAPHEPGLTVQSNAVGDPLQDPALVELLGSRTLTDTEKDALVKLRVGQGFFREQLVKRWGGCSVSGCTHEALLIASHIIPWRLCENGSDRLNPANGLLLTPNLDKLFDRGLISFDERGAILVSSKLHLAAERALGVDIGMKLRRVPDDDLERYMARHRAEIFQGPAKPRPASTRVAGAAADST